MPMSTPVARGYAPPPGPDNATHRPLLRRWLAVGGLLLAFGVGALVLAWAFGDALGVEVMLYATVAALIPVAIVVPAFLWLDRHEAEPPSSLLVAFAWGALVATSISLVVNSFGAAALWAVGLDGDLFAMVAVAPVVEELTKGLGILVVWALRRREFDGILDGIVYAGIVAAGFAFGENILYLGQSLIEGGTAGLVATFVVRGLVSPFAHPLFTVWIGVGLGVLVESRSLLRFLAPLGGFVLAVVLHGLWNASTIFGMAGWFSVYVLVQIPVFAATVWFALWIRRREGRTVAAHLEHYARLGLFTPADLQMLARSDRRRAALSWARRAGGRPAATAMRDFQDDAVELGQLRARYLRGHAGPAVDAEEHRLVDSVLRARHGLDRATSAPR